jgi:hypothetical protein
MVSVMLLSRKVLFETGRPFCGSKLSQVLPVLGCSCLLLPPLFQQSLPLRNSMRAETY